MPSTGAGRRTALIYVALMAITLVLLAVSGTGPVTEMRRGVGFALTPIQEMLSNGTRAVTSVFSAFGQVAELRQDNQRLEDRIQTLEVENRRLEEIRIENAQLSALLKLQSTLDYASVPASVIGRGADESERVITLDRGPIAASRNRTSSSRAAVRSSGSSSTWAGPTATSGSTATRGPWSSAWSSRAGRPATSRANSAGRW